ncbi:MAG: hypothetical protein KUG70_07250 [Rhodobacteraceae bacterium]|nr:hypothetical protein [Paracoccaceae bacterium]
MTTANEQLSMVAPESTDPGAADVEARIPIKLAQVGSAAIVSIILQICGTALILTAPALWLLPGSNVSADLLPIKLGMTLLFFLCGLVLLMRNHSDAQPEVYFDPIRREMRVLQRNDRGRPETILRRSYDTLGAVQFSKRSLEMWDVDGSVLMRLSLPDEKMRRVLRMHFSGLVRVSN